MENKNVPIGEAVSYGWQKFKDNWTLLLAVSLISAVLSAPQEKINDLNSDHIAWSLLSLSIAVLSTIVTIGILKLTLKIYDSKKPEILDIFRYSRYFWRYLGGSILLGLIVTAGLLLLIVPGFIWAFKYSQTLNLIVDKDMPVMDALHQSAEMTNGVKWQLFLFGLVSVGVIILGALALGVGVLVAIPVVWLAQIYVYRYLLGTTNKSE